MAVNHQRCSAVDAEGQDRTHWRPVEAAAERAEGYCVVKSAGPPLAGEEVSQCLGY